jgi:hypothetical protein
VFEGFLSVWGYSMLYMYILICTVYIPVHSSMYFVCFLIYINTCFYFWFFLFDLSGTHFNIFKSKPCTFLKTRSWISRIIPRYSLDWAPLGREKIICFLLSLASLLLLFGCATAYPSQSQPRFRKSVPMSCSLDKGKTFKVLALHGKGENGANHRPQRVRAGPTGIWRRSSFSETAAHTIL